MSSVRGIIAGTLGLTMLQAIVGSATTTNNAVGLIGFVSSALGRWFNPYTPLIPDLRESLLKKRFNKGASPLPTPAPNNSPSVPPGHDSNPGGGGGAAPPAAPAPNRPGSLPPGHDTAPAVPRSSTAPRPT